METVSYLSQFLSGHRKLAQRLKYASICVCEPMGDLIGELAALCAAISWTFSAVFYRKALSVASPFQANLIRFTSVSAVLVTFLATMGQIVVLTSLSISVTAIAALSGIVGLVLGDTLYMFALRSLGVARAVPICSIYPLFNLLIAVLLKGERITSFVAFGAVSVVAGIWLISSKKPDSSASSEEVPRKGLAVALSTAVVWSVGMTLLSIAVTSPGIIGLNVVLAVMSLRVLAAWIVLLALAPFLDRGFGFLKMSWRTWLLMVLGGLIGLGVGNFLLSYSFLYTQEARAVPISSTTPFFSVIAGIVLLHEPVTPWIVLGSLTIVLGTFLLFI
jgi:DME family drug/metabolite transporter